MDEIVLVVACVSALSGCVGISERDTSGSSPRPVAAHDISSEDEVPPVEFGRDVLPILQAECRPCHFEGGKMYDELPFDREETIVDLGERVLTRIDDGADRQVVRRFLER